MTVDEAIEQLWKTTGLMRPTELGTSRMKVTLVWAVIDTRTGREQVTRYRLDDALAAADELTASEENQDALKARETE